MAMKVKTRQSKERGERVTGRGQQGWCINRLKEVPFRGTLRDILEYLGILGKYLSEFVADTAIHSHPSPSYHLQTLPRFKGGQAPLHPSS